MLPKPGLKIARGAAARDFGGGQERDTSAGGRYIATIEFAIKNPQSII